MGNQLEALEIYQRLLDVLSDGVMKSDSMLVASYLARPFHMRTAKGWFPMNTFDDIEQVVSSMHLSFKIQGVTDYLRNASEANFTASGDIEGVHKTHILKNDRPLITGYESRMTLKKSGDDWLVAEARHSIDNSKWPVAMPKVSTGTISDLDRQTENDAVAMEIYQTLIDGLTVANVSGDAKAWHDLCEFPHSVRIDNIGQVIKSPKDTTTFLNTMSDILDNAKNDAFKRSATFAGFLSENIIRGYHTTTLGTKESAVFRPIQSRITIRRKNDRWRIIELVNSIANNEFPYETPDVSPSLISEFHNPKKALQK